MINAKHMRAVDGNEAVANVAYKVTEISALYPITPASPMGEHADQWAADGVKNIWGMVPEVVEMQSEGGASATLHGLVQTGALATTYTASQGLLLMLPSMYKMAGELLPLVIHVAARSLAVQALSIFGDFSDVMAVRQTGFAMLASSNVQEAQDLALIAHAATLEATVPFIHFFEGFRISHEISKIELLSDEEMRAMMDDELVLAQRRHALDPDRAVMRGTSQNPDVYFQGRESVNPCYVKVPEIIERMLQKFEKITGRHYDLVSYEGAPDADRVMVMMGAGAETVYETVTHLNQQGEKLGLLRIRLFRPFPKFYFLKLIPKTVKSIAVLDRTKEPGSVGEPLYQDVVTTLTESKMTPQVIGGRYGLSSKEFTPAMVKAIFDELKKETPKNHFTIGIHDDVSHTSLDYDETFQILPEGMCRCIFFGLGADGTVGANKNSIKIIADETDNYAQGYFVYDSKKSGSRTVSHLRFGPHPIHSPYLVQSADFVGVHQFNFLEKTDVLKTARVGATLLINSPYAYDKVWAEIPGPVQQKIIDKKIKVYVVNAYKIADETGMGSRINTIMQTCFFELTKVLSPEKAIAKIKETIQKTYCCKGQSIVDKNFAAVDQALSHLFEVEVPSAVSASAKPLPPVVSDKAPAFVKDVTAVLMADRGDELPVSKMPVDGTFPMSTTRWEKRNVSMDVSDWNPEICIQCGRCSFVCPHAVIRVKRFGEEQLKGAPKEFKYAKAKNAGEECFSLQVYIEDCTGCGLCCEACPVKDKEREGKKAINITSKAPILEKEKKNIEFFETINNMDRAKMDMSTLPGVQYADALFEFSGACAGCGETPYLSLLTRLFGERMLVANATGCSSIYGGNLPTTPWATNSKGQGPAWNNSLFEDNAEFGFGFRLSADQLAAQAKILLKEFASTLGDILVDKLIAHANDNDEAEIAKQRDRVAALKSKLKDVNDMRAKHLLTIADNLVKRSVWLIGGDGWAYDIGYGGLDHVLAAGRDVNVLVLDTEVYSNTGGQASKATPRGAVAKFAAAGRKTPKKDLAMMAVIYGNVYVAQIAMGANMPQTLKAMLEAESYPGSSIIIAYSHCIAHEYNLRLGLNQQKLAVESGAWPLFRYDPRREAEKLNPFVLDSKAPSIPMQDYMYNEGRFKSLVGHYPDAATALLKEAQADADRRWALYEYLAKREF